MSDLWLIRHGPTHQTTFTGWRDVPADLSDTAAVARLSGYLPAGAVVISSDLMRARDTATAIQGGRRRLPDDARLREFDFGAWDGLHHTEVAARDPELSRAFWDEAGDLRAPDGESWNMVEDRVWPALCALRAAHGTIIAVMHMGAIMTAIRAATGCTPYQAMSHKLDPLGATCIAADGTVGPINHQP
ncbi:MAG: histidine phosphatase family protein [Pseudomonadota bacterium]